MYQLLGMMTNELYLKGFFTWSKRVLAINMSKGNTAIVHVIGG